VAAAAAAAFWLCGLPLLLSFGNSQRLNGYIIGML
jgi:hypothetical protein